MTHTAVVTLRGQISTHKCNIFKYDTAAPMKSPLWANLPIGSHQQDEDIIMQAFDGSSPL